MFHRRMFFRKNQEHLLKSCQPLLSKFKNIDQHIKYQDIFSTIKKQHKIVKIFSKLLTKRAKMLNLP